MKIELDENEIKSALESYVLGKINVGAGNTIEVDFKAGRGDNGPTATLNIVPATADEAPVKAVPTPAPAMTESEVTSETSEEEEEEETSSGPAENSSSLFSKAS